MKQVMRIKSIFIKDKFVSEITIGEANVYGYVVTTIDKVFASDFPLGNGYLVTSQSEEKVKTLFFPDWAVKEVALEHAES